MSRQLCPFKLDNGTVLHLVPYGYAGGWDRCPECHEDAERWLCRSVDNVPEIECKRCGCVYVPKPRTISQPAKELEQETQCDCVIETQSCPECRAAAAARYPGNVLPF